ncbi:MAG: hypothetical protein JSW66_19780 [Phycisphaerales bacterium]|nr:MAG: hypothetical protein JSW66_19780 [Phycisphaerales bacterium]
MKRYVISAVAVMMVLLTVLAAVGQEERARARQGRGGFMGREERLKAIEAIEAQLAKLKEGSQTTGFSRESFQNMSEEERTKAMERFRQARAEREKALQAVMAQVALLQGRRPPDAEGVRYLIINTEDLKPIQEAATKEKAKQTSELLARLVARGSGRRFGGRRPGSEGGQRDRGTGTRGGDANR